MRMSTSPNNTRQKRRWPHLKICVEGKYTAIKLHYTAILWRAAVTQWWRSGAKTRPPPMWLAVDSQTRRLMWVEFVGSLLCSERFCPGYSGFPLFSKTYIWFESILIQFVKEEVHCRDVTNKAVIIRELKQTRRRRKRERHLKMWLRVSVIIFQLFKLLCLRNVFQLSWN